jgi:hypothetical protein
MFLRQGGISREPDFIVKGLDTELKIEFQYADREDLQYFDFKISKVARKVKGERRPHEDRIFLYILKPSSKYAFLTPKWIFKNSISGSVPAWGNREAYRVPKDVFLEQFKYDEKLEEIIALIDAKNYILEFQHELIEIWKEELSNLVQRVVDENKIVKILPKNLESFFRVCFILDHIYRVPENKNMWLVYLLSYVNDDLKLKEIAKLCYSLDFLYSKIDKLESNELYVLKEKIRVLLGLINKYSQNNDLYISDLDKSLIEETRFALFSINLLEDIIQELIFYYGVDFKPISRIYEHVESPLETYNVLRGTLRFNAKQS